MIQGDGIKDTHTYMPIYVPNIFHFPQSLVSLNIAGLANDMAGQ